MLTRSFVFALVAGLSWGFAALGQPVKFALDNSHSAVIFGVGHAGLSYTYGRFNKLSGEFALDNADPTKTQFKVTIDASSIDTNDAKRDEHLRGAEFFDVAQFPTLEFTTTAVTKTEKGFELKGNMTIHGVTKELMIPLTKVGEGPTPSGDYRAGFLAQFGLKRSDYGMTTHGNMVGDDVTITFSFEGVRQQ
jgi:polyisoprenoid-binding protein YceI